MLDRLLAWVLVAAQCGGDWRQGCEFAATPNRLLALQLNKANLNIPYGENCRRHSNLTGYSPHLWSWCVQLDNGISFYRLSAASWGSSRSHYCGKHEALLITKNPRSKTSNIYVTVHQKVSMPNLFVASLQLKQWQATIPLFFVSTKPFFHFK